MSIVITTDVFCDGDGCSLWVHGVTGPRTDHPYARRAAELVGWERSRGRDLCPDCYKREVAAKVRKGLEPKL